MGQGRQKRRRHAQLIVGWQTLGNLSFQSTYPHADRKCRLLADSVEKVRLSTRSDFLSAVGASFETNAGDPVVCARVSTERSQWIYAGNQR